jgi:Potential Monad-binding region of RPAP3
MAHTLYQYVTCLLHIQHMSLCIYHLYLVSCAPSHTSTAPPSLSRSRSRSYIYSFDAPGHYSCIQINQPNENRSANTLPDSIVDAVHLGQSSKDTAKSEQIAASELESAIADHKYQVPTTGFELQRVLSSVCKTDEERLEYLQHIEPSELPHLCHTVLSEELIQYILQALHAAPLATSSSSSCEIAGKCIDILYHFSKTPRFGMTVAFLGDDAQALASQMFAKLAKLSPWPSATCTSMELHELYEQEE